MAEANREVAVDESEFSFFDPEFVGTSDKAGSNGKNNPASSEVIELPLSEIEPDLNQPRKYFDDEALESLADAFKAYGTKHVVLIVRPNPNSTGYLLVAGERRYKALNKMGAHSVNCTIQAMDDEQALEFAVMENRKRRDLSELETIEALITMLMKKHDEDRAWVLEHLGSITHPDARGNVSSEIEITEKCLSIFDLKKDVTRKHLSLLDLPEEIKLAHMEGKLAWTKAVKIGQIKNTDLWEPLLARTVEEGLSVRELTAEVKTLKQKDAVNNASKLSAQSSVATQLKEVVRDLTKAKKWKQIESDKKKRAKAQKLLKELEALLED